MKKYPIILIIISLLSSGFSSIASFNITDENQVTIYRIDKDTIKIVNTIYKQRSINNNLVSSPIYNKNNVNTNDFVIITSEDLEDSIISSSFISWKESLGFNIRIVKISEDYIQNQNGKDLQEKIRNFLIEYYQQWCIKYVLIIGDIETIPMRYCYPNPDNHRFDIFDYTSGEVPTDYYYADLSYPDSESWDSDRDGYHGEFTQDHPDFMAEVYVGRIPISIPSRITYTLDKTVAFEKDTRMWKYNAINAGAFFYFENEDHYYSSMDGAVLSYYIEKDFMDEWTVSHYSEQQGLEVSIYDWQGINEKDFVNDWKNGQYGIVNWQGHGWTNQVARKVWTNDDGDKVPESNEISWPRFISRNSNLDDDYPSIVTAVSCYVGCPELDPNANGNLGIDLLTDPSFGASIGVIASARSPYGSIDWPNNPGGTDQIIYEFNKNLIVNKERVGEALYNSKYYSNLNYGWDHYAEYIDMFTYNLYGDPTLQYEGIFTDNNPPEKPIINGPISGIVGEAYSFNISSIDPDGDNVFFYVEWFEGCPGIFWDGPYSSGQMITVNNTWESKGNHIITVKVRDEHGLIGEIATFPITIPKSQLQIKNIFEQIIQYFIFNFIY